MPRAIADEVWVRASVAEGRTTPTTDEAPGFPGGFSGADDEIRTRDPHLGKVMLYQLSYVRNGSRV